MAITNVPFSDAKIADPLDPALNKPSPHSLHNYFFAKAAKKVRPGGIVAFVTSHFTMDSPTSKIRQKLGEMGMKLVGTVRLPNDAFKKMAGTRVTTDIIFLQKGGTGGEAWNNTPSASLPTAKAIKAVTWPGSVCR